MPEPSTNRLIRFGGATVAAGLAVAIFASMDTYRNGEAHIEAYLINHLSGIETVAIPNTATVMTGVGTSQAIGFQVSTDCSSSLLVGGLLILTAAVLLARNWNLRSVLYAVAAAAAVVIATNLARLSLIIWATREWNQAGFNWTHVYAGTFITLISVVAAAAVYLVILGHDQHPLQATEAA